MSLHNEIMAIECVVPSWPDSYTLGFSNARFAAAQLATKADAEIARLTGALGNLLAVIHRDGGQYLAEHGVEKACADAEAEVAKWIMLESSVDALIEASARAERESCALACERRAESAHYADRPGLAMQCAKDIRARSEQ